MPPVQPAQVVPEDVRQALSKMDDEIIAELDAEESACRAAMLHAGNSPGQSDCCPAQNCIHSAQGVDRPVAWHHSAKSKEGNHGTCCFSYASSHDFGPRYEKPQSQPHYLPERLDYDRALHFLSTEPRKVTPETVIGGNSPVIPEGSASMLRRWLAFGCGMQNAGSQLPRNLIAETEAMLADAPHDTPALNSVQSVVTVPGKWIPVSERIPEDRTQVILWDAEIGEVTSGHYSHKTHTFYHCGDAIENEITHWMAPPAAPQEVSDA
ncbi:TPA: DUF551 domain-containing protein [Klebsiella pneumoniae]